ncbi:Bgt-1534 [Blumeria graminis f. sp. tritici]|uniref:MICOS complex subunit MIC60 n=2 Tax=Blumeria graminis f. sp. tritici TaxID=62690 RepID=A0A061HS81_BLUGR|nr:hypothetical protein BGT96224_1534 [Blumeria graminis f. sp. tritici 96224]VDB92878.1 Bgt-1534 [Blumeria graminis f. sp. tritici]
MLRASSRPALSKIIPRLSGVDGAARKCRTSQASGIGAIINKSFASQSKLPSQKSEPKVRPDPTSFSPQPTITSERLAKTETLDFKSSALPTRNESSPNALPNPQPAIPATTKRRFLPKFITSILLLGVLAYGGGIYYTKFNDNFYDFFTEYVPFGEEAVLYFEEKNPQKRNTDHSGLKSNMVEGDMIRFPSQSGVSWRLADAQDLGSTGRHANATSSYAKQTEPQIEKEVSNNPTSRENSSQNTASTNKSSNSNHSETNEKLPALAKPHDIADTYTTRIEPSPKSPLEIEFIDPINIENANEPLVQDLVRIINNVITVVNADKSGVKFSSTIEKAKKELSQAGSRIRAIKNEAMSDAESKIQTEKEDFDRAAKELVRRIEAEMKLQQSNWQEEYQAERQIIQETYEKKLNVEMQRANELNQQRLQNALLEQALEMKKQFTQEIKDRVEEERNRRLGKLTDLSKTVNDLEKLTTDWNSVVDFNLKTQQLHVAVEAVRTSLENSDEPRPFVRELLALREIASEDPVVNAAITSINPIAYQSGIPSPSQLIDRFRRVAFQVRKAALLPEDAGVASHASSLILSKLMFKKKGLTSGDDVESVLTRAEFFLEGGDLDSAAREVNGLKGWGKTLSRDWLDEVRRVLEVRQALDVIATEARLKSLIVD